MATLHAQPLNSLSDGFFFNSFKEFQKKLASQKRNTETTSYNIKFIDGYPVDAWLFNSLSITAVNLEDFLEACETWPEEDKFKVIICVDECGYTFNIQSDTPDQFEVDIYQMNSLKELAEYFVEEGLFGEIPEHLENYIDYGAIAYDLSFDYAETVICDLRLIYRCM